MLFGILRLHEVNGLNSRQSEYGEERGKGSLTGRVIVQPIKTKEWSDLSPFPSSLAVVSTLVPSKSAYVHHSQGLQCNTNTKPSLVPYRLDVTVPGSLPYQGLSVSFNTDSFLQDLHTFPPFARVVYSHCHLPPMLQIPNAFRCRGLMKKCAVIWFIVGCSHSCIPWTGLAETLKNSFFRLLFL